MRLNVNNDVILSEAKNLVKFTGCLLIVGCSNNLFEESQPAQEDMKQFSVYIMTNKSKTLYTGVANDLERRVYEHKQKLVPGFTSRYNITMLLYFEMTTDVKAAISREKQIKGWLRSKKIDLIESVNPDWKDRSE
jgi:putative endonuclease